MDNMMDILDILLRHYVLSGIVLYAVGFFGWWKMYQKDSDNHHPPSPSACVLFGSWMSLWVLILPIVLVVAAGICIVLGFQKHAKKIRDSRPEKYDHKNPYSYSWFWRPITLPKKVKDE